MGDPFQPRRGAAGSSSGVTLGGTLPGSTRQTRINPPPCTWSATATTRPERTVDSSENPRVNTVAGVNQKGGLGKPTLTLGLAAAAQSAGARVLVVDLDPQASSTWVLGHDPAQVDR